MEEMERKKEKGRRFAEALDMLPEEMATKIEESVIAVAWAYQLMKKGHKEKTA